MKLSIIIISYNTREMTLACLRSVFEQTRETAFEVIVLDNASKDGSYEAITAEFPSIKVIGSPKNIGYAAGTNKAAEQATGEYILHLNPDTVILDGAIDRIVARADTRPEYGAWGGKTLFGDGTLNPSSGWNKTTIWSMTCLGLGLTALFKRSRLFNPESLASWSWDKPRDIDIVTGCFLLIRADLWRRLEGFDLRFFMYGEDADLSLRIWESGYKCELVPEAVIIHYDGASEKIKADKMCRLFAAQALTYRKHMTPFTAGYCISMLRLWALTRKAANTLFGLASSKRRESADSWAIVLKRAPLWSRGQFLP